MSENSRLRFEPTVTMGNVGQMLFVGVGVVIWLVTGSNKADEAQRDLAAFQLSVSAQLAEIKTTVDKRFDLVAQQIMSVPTVAAQMALQDRRITAAEDRNAGQDQRISTLEQSQAGMRSDLENIKVQSQGHRQ